MFASIWRRLAGFFRAFSRSQTTAPSVPQDTLVIYVGDASATVNLRPGTRTILGRNDSYFPDIHPDIDLEPYGALEKGVSHLHAVITYIDQTGVFVEDLNNSNGTFVNDVRVEPGFVERLTDGCFLCLGTLVAYISLEIKPGYPFRQDPPPHWVVLTHPHKGAEWREYGLTWHALLLAAYRYGWHPALWPSSGGTQLSIDDAHELADALERALPDLGDSWRVGMAVAMGRLPVLESPLSYLGGDIGRGLVQELISFCRQESDTPGDIVVSPPTVNDDWRMRGRGPLRSRVFLILSVQGMGTKFEFDADQVEELTIGCKDPDTGEAPDVDLLDVGALAQGVSRKHASIILKDGSLQIVDNGSMYGTYLNGHKLEPRQPSVIRDGDDIRLGKLILRIEFQPEIPLSSRSFR